MRYLERPLVFDCEGEFLVGVLAAPEAPAATGVLVVVGGPQYRAGSHRQFVHLARRLAADGIAVLRFDYRGMGDASGAPCSFEDCAADIAAAADTLIAQSPGLTRIVLWGLCDAASAILMYLQQRHDPRIAGIVLLNPWVRSPATLSKTHLKHWYGKRLVAADFWRKVFSGGFHFRDALRGFIASVRTAAARSRPAARQDRATFQDRMLEGLRSFGGPTLLVLSGDDLTAKEFLEYAHSMPAWRRLLERPDIERCEIDGADHTFSSASHSAEVEARTLRWLGASFIGGSR